MNFSLAREIYGLTPWFVDSVSLPGLLGALDNISTFEKTSQKLNSVSLFTYVNSETRFVERPYQLDNSEDFSAIAVIKLDGPITLNGGESSYGMKQLSNRMIALSNDSRVKAFIIVANSGGGASGAVKVMSDTINLVISKAIPVYGLIEKGGIAASACYGILSSCTKIYSEDGMNIVGSAGTMIEFSGREANSEDKDGVKYVRLYATKSKKKNKGFEDALNKNDYTVLIDELLDPVNESFLELIESNRPALKGTDFNDGHTVFSKDSIGKFVDGIKSFDELVDDISSSINFTNSGTNINSINNLNTNTMTKSELQSKFPALHQEVYSDGLKNGISAERDRSGAWMAHLATDSAAVIAGIESGENISQKQTQEFIVKQNSQTQLANLAADSTTAAPTGEAVIDEGKDVDEVDAFYAGIDSKLNLKKD